MELNTILLDFAMSLISGRTYEWLKNVNGNNTVNDRINTCFQKALNKWDMPASVRESIYNNPIKYYSDLEMFLNRSHKGMHPKIAELIHLWVSEMLNEPICTQYIFLHRQELEIDEIRALRHQLEDVIRDNVSSTKEGIENIDKNVKEILTFLRDNQSISNNDPSEKILTLLNGILLDLIEKLKVTSALKIIYEIERDFPLCIEKNKHIQAKLSFLKGKALLLSNASEAKKYLYYAYKLLPDIQEYKAMEVRRLLYLLKYDEAKAVASTITNSPKWNYLVAIVCSEDKARLFETLPQDIQKDYDFRELIIEHTANSQSANINFLFDNVNPIHSKELTYSTLNEWMFIFTHHRVKTTQQLLLSFANLSDNNSFGEASKASNQFYTQLSETEIKDSFPMLRCLHCYWNYICSRDSKWIKQFQETDKSTFSNQTEFFYLLESTMLLLNENFNQAFNIITTHIYHFDNNKIRYAILLSTLTKDTDNLKWVFEQIEKSEIKIDSLTASVIADLITKDRANFLRTSIQKQIFEIEAEKEILVQLCDFFENNKVDISDIENKLPLISNELKAFAAELLALNGEEQMAFEILSPIVDVDIPDRKRDIFLMILSKLQEKTPELYRILTKNRHSKNYCDDKLLEMEYNLDVRVADFKNALEAISLLYKRHPENPYIFTNYISTLGSIHPNQLAKYEQQALCFNYPEEQLGVQVYKVLSENGYIQTALQLLYKMAKISEDTNLKMFYFQETTDGPIRDIVEDDHETAEEGYYVLCDNGTNRCFYQATCNGNNICQELIGKQKGDTIEVTVGLERMKLNIICICDKYGKLAGDIMLEAVNGGYPNLIPFKADLENPLESLEKIFQSINQGKESPAQRFKNAQEKYEQGELALANLVNEDNLLASYYKLLFSDFKIYVNILQVEMLKVQQQYSKQDFVLDLPSAITFAEFTAKTGMSIKGPKSVTTILHEYIRAAVKKGLRITDSDFYEAIRSNRIIRFSELADIDAKAHINNLLQWIDDNCQDVIPEESLILDQKEKGIYSHMVLFSAFSLLINPNHYLVSDDKKISTLLKHARVITTETYVRLFNDETTSAAYSEFLFDNKFYGVQLEALYIVNEFKKLINEKENKIAEIINNVKINPLMLETCMSAYMQLLTDIEEKDLAILNTTFVDIFKYTLLSFNQESRENLIHQIFELLDGYQFTNKSDYAIFCTKQCLQLAFDSMEKDK